MSECAPVLAECDFERGKRVERTGSLNGIGARLIEGLTVLLCGRVAISLGLETGAFAQRILKVGCTGHRRGQPEGDNEQYHARMLPRRDSGDFRVPAMEPRLS